MAAHHEAVLRVARAANASLIGAAKGRERLLTPSLLVELDVLDANIAGMQARCDRAGIALRPHAKAHKCVALARRQLAAGAVGLCVATPGEAEVFAQAGLPDLLVTSTFAPGATVERLATIATQCQLTLVLDAAETARALGAAARARNLQIPVLVDLDMGRHRSGVEGSEAVAELAGVVAQEDGLVLKGLQAYAGHLSHRVDAQERSAGVQEAAAQIRVACEALQPFMQGARPVVTGASTGAFEQELATGVYTEFQCGSYALMDAEYDLVDPDGTGRPAYPTSLFVAVRVISANTPGMATTDGGEKRFAAKHGTAPVIVRGAPAGSSYRPSSDEHGTVTLPQSTQLAVGSLIELQVPHCDPTVNLYDFIHVMRGDELVEIWPVDARGA
ncbi:MAG TPA: alanine racemase [Ancylobacter sp.]